jgi:hypothetical protein
MCYIKKLKFVSLYKFFINLTKAPRMSQQKMTQEKNIDVSVAIAPPKFQIPSDSLEDCPICMEKIIGVNISVTTCGHAFHCFCLLTAVESNEECPLCRHPLVKIEYDTDDEGENNTDGDDGSETIGSNSTRSSDDEEDSIVTLEALTNKISNLGYTMKDLIYMLTPIRSDDPKYTEDYCENLFDTIDKIKDGRIPLSQRDTRSYSQVLIGSASEPEPEPEQVQMPEITYLHEEEKEEVDIFNEVMTTIDIMIVRLENNIRPTTIKYQWNPEVISY